MSFWQSYAHFVWATDHREAIIDHGCEPVIVRSIQSICTDWEVILHAIGIVPDHIHIAVSIPPKYAPADFIRRIKGTSSHYLNDAVFRPRGETFRWQPEYGYLSFGAKSLDRIVAYVGSQKHDTRQVRRGRSTRP